MCESLAQNYKMLPTWGGSHVPLESPPHPGRSTPYLVTSYSLLQCSGCWQICLGVNVSRVALRAWRARLQTNRGHCSASLCVELKEENAVDMYTTSEKLNSRPVPCWESETGWITFTTERGREVIDKSEVLSTVTLGSDSFSQASTL